MIIMTVNYVFFTNLEGLSTSERGKKIQYSREILEKAGIKIIDLSTSPLYERFYVEVETKLPYYVRRELLSRLDVTPVGPFNTKEGAIEICLHGLS